MYYIFYFLSHCYVNLPNSDMDNSSLIYRDTRVMGNADHIAGFQF